MACDRRPERLTSRQWSCSSLASALNNMDASDLLAALPDDPAELAKFVQDSVTGSPLSFCLGLSADFINTS